MSADEERKKLVKNLALGTLMRMKKYNFSESEVKAYVKCIEGCLNIAVSKEAQKENGAN